MGLVKILQGLAGLSNIIYLLAWILALIGLSYQQNWCKDHEGLASGFTGLGLNAPYVGKDCSKLWRFAWFVWAFSALPLLLSIGSIIKPHMVARGSGSLFAVAIVLQILMANMFFNLYTYIAETGTLDVGAEGVTDTISTNDTIGDWTRVALSGFAIMAAAGLLAVVFEAVTDPSETRKTRRSDAHDDVDRHSHGRRHSRDSSRDLRDRDLRDRDAYGKDDVRGNRDARVPVGGRVVDTRPVVHGEGLPVRHEPVVVRQDVQPVRV